MCATRFCVGSSTDRREGDLTTSVVLKLMKYGKFLRPFWGSVSSQVMECFSHLPPYHPDRWSAIWSQMKSILNVDVLIKVIRSAFKMTILPRVWILCCHLLDIMKYGVFLSGKSPRFCFLMESNYMYKCFPDFDVSFLGGNACIYIPLLQKHCQGWGLCAYDYIVCIGEQIMDIIM